MVEDLGALALLNIAPVELPDSTPHGTWPCWTCDADYDVHHGWVVTLRSHEDGAVEEQVVCPDCAQRFQKRRDR